MQDKEKLVRAHAFPPSPAFHGSEYKPGQGVVHLSISKEDVGKALLCQSVKKTPGPNMHNFRVICLFWDWDPDCSTIHKDGELQKGFFWKNQIKETVRLSNPIGLSVF